ncbi:MAG: NAD-dependent epimerase/dehydratase family protein [Actinomycetales bacterium]
MRVLVTGGAGFIGSHIVEQLVAAGHETVVLDSLDPGVHTGSRWPTELPDVARVVADIRDRDALDDTLSGIDVVCHQAAKVGLGVDVQDLPGYADVNVTGTAHLLAAMAQAGVQALVFASSMVVYGEGGYECPEHGSVRPGPRIVQDLDAGRFEPPCPTCGAALDWHLVGEGVPNDPRNAYAASKVAQEHFSSSWARATGGRVIALRYHNVYGPRMPRDTPYAGVASIFRSALAAGRAPQVFEDGGQLRDFVHVRDVARANRLAIEQLSMVPAGGLTAYNVASGTPRSVGDLARELSAAMDGPSPEVTGQYRLGDVRHVVADPAAAAAQLGFTAEIDLATGMAEFADQQV